MDDRHGFMVECEEVDLPESFRVGPKTNHFHFHNSTSPFLFYGGTMGNAKTAKPVDYMYLKEVRELLYELERLGLVKRTGEFQNGNPVFISTVEVNGAMNRQRRG